MTGADGLGTGTQQCVQPSECPCHGTLQPAHQAMFQASSQGQGQKGCSCLPSKTEHMPMKASSYNTVSGCLTSAGWVCAWVFQTAAYALVLGPTLQPETHLISCPSSGPLGSSEAAPQTGLPLRGAAAETQHLHGTCNIHKGHTISTCSSSSEYTSHSVPHGKT